MTEPLQAQDRRAERLFAATARDFHPFPQELLDLPLTAAFHRAVAQFGERIAIHGRNHTWSYRDLDRHSRQIAQAVRARLGAGEGPVVLLCYHDAPGIAALWGVLLAGKFYVPLDLAYPAARLQTVLDDLQTRLVIVERATLPLVEALGLPAQQVMVVEDVLEAATLAAELAELPSVPVTSPAYIIFTSGTTGAPKGVIETHRNVARFTQYSVDTWKLCPHDVHLMMTSLSFSGTATLIFPPLFSGAAVYCVDTQRDGMGALRRALQEGGVTVASIPPAILRILPDLLGDLPLVPTLRQVRMGGDKILAADLAVVRQLAPTTCVARIGYGLSELKYATALHADAQTVLPGAAMPGGFPVEYVTVEIHGDDGKVLPAGETGEIVLYSDYLSPGYWRRPEITAAKYVVDAAGRRCYRTGDLGYLDDEGCLWMLGRRDGQLKILGQRVETSEVEAALAALPGVREALVVARARPDGEMELVAYVVQTADSLWDAATVRRRLAELLPTYMVPVAVGFLDQFPRNTNHKPDRSRLPAIETPATHAADLPMSPREAEVAALVGELLGRPPVGRDQNIFDLGAHSLLAARLAMRIRRRFGVELPVRMILAGATVAEITRYLDQAEAGSAPAAPLSLLVQPGKPDHTPLFLCLGGGGSETELMWYAALLRRLDPDQPIVALLGRGTGGDESAHASVEAMVADYLAAIRSGQPHGPYLLGGECIGAKLAFLLAQRLEAAGETVANLLLLDATAPVPDQLQNGRARWQQWQRRALYHWDYVQRLGMAEGANYLWHRLATRLPGNMWGDPRVRRSLMARACYRRLLGELAVTGRVQAPVLMIASDESGRAGVPAAWRSLLAGDVVEETVPGNHRSYLGAYVHITGDAVRRQLAPVLLPHQAAWSIRP